MRPILKGAVPNDEDGNPVIFKEYSRARRYLIDRIGEYCSYCERKIEASLAVEHVQPKSLSPELELEWDNFLLACTNCNSTKGDKVIVLEDFVWPDMQNTFVCFNYDDSGIVKVSERIAPALKIRAQNMVELVGLQVHPPREGSPDWERASDRRFEQRQMAWSEANRHLDIYRNASIDVRALMLPLIIEIVIHQGFWSIYVTVFGEFPSIQAEFIEAARGTNRQYFLNDDQLI